MNNVQGPLHRTGCQLWLVVLRDKPSWPVTGGEDCFSPLIHFSSFFFFFFLWADDFNSLSSLPCLCLTCSGHFIDMRRFFHQTSWRDSVCGCVCTVCYLFVLSVLFCVTSVRLCGRTYWVNASQFIFLYPCNAIWYFYYTSCIGSFSSLFIYFPCKYIFC